MDCFIFLSYCDARYPTEEQVRKYKRKESKLYDDGDDKCVDIREDLAYKIIGFTNLGVIEAGEFRKNLGITNNQ